MHYAINNKNLFNVHEVVVLCMCNTLFVQVDYNYVNNSKMHIYIITTK